MASPHAPSLPKGAKGIDIGDLVLKVGRDKLILSTAGQEGHFTLAFGSRSKVLDLHRTWIGSDGEERHEPLLQIAHAEFGPIFREFEERYLHTTQRLAKETRRLRPGWICRHGIVAIPALLAPEAPMALMRVRKQRLFFDPELAQNYPNILANPDSLYSLPIGQCFPLIQVRGHGCSRMIGLGFRAETKGKASLHWIPVRILKTEIRQLWDFFDKAAEDHRWQGAWSEGSGPILDVCLDSYDSP